MTFSDTVKEGTVLSALRSSCVRVPQSLQINIFVIHMEYIFSCEKHLKYSLTSVKYVRVYV